MKSKTLVSIIAAFTFYFQAICLSAPLVQSQQLIKIESAYSDSRQHVPASCRMLSDMFARLEKNLAERALQNHLQKSTNKIDHWTILDQEWVNNAWENKYKDIVQFNANAELIVSSITYEWQNSAWKNSMRMTGELTGTNQLSSITIEIWKNDAWLLDTRISYEYNGADQCTLITILADENGDGVLENALKTESSFDGNGYLVMEKVFFEEAGEWAEFEIVEYTNDSSGRTVERLAKMHLGGGEYMLASKTIFEYDGAGNAVVETDFGFDFMSQTWFKNSKTTTAYNGNNDAIESLYQTWNGTAWMNERLVKDSYDGQYRHIEMLEQIWDGASWIHKKRNGNIYDGDKLTESLFQMWDNGWQNSERLLYDYSNTTGIADHVQRPAAFRLRNYPNPFNPTTMFVFTLDEPQAIVLQVFDVNGRLVNVLLNGEKHSAGQHAVVWNGIDSHGQTLSSGVYYYSIIAGEIKQTSRCVLVR